MTSRSMVLATAALAVWSLLPIAPRAQTDSSPARSLAEPLSATRQQVRPAAADLPVPPGFTRDQIMHGDRVFHGEAAGGQCSTCHGVDAKGTPVGNDLTTGMYVWGDGTVNGVKRTLMHNMAIAPRMDGDLQPADVDAVAAYVWALGQQTIEDERRRDEAAASASR